MKYNAESKLKMIHEYLEKKQLMLALSIRIDLETNPHEFSLLYGY